MKKWFVFLALFLVGCGALNNGTVLDRKFVPKHMESDFIYIGDVMVPTSKEVSDEWYLLIKNGDRTNWIYVHKDVYDSIEIGDHWERQNGR